MSHVHKAQDVTWQCDKLMHVFLAAPGHFTFPGISKLLSFGGWFVEFRLDIQREEGSLKCHELFPFQLSRVTSLWRFMINIWWAGFKITQQSQETFLTVLKGLYFWQLRQNQQNELLNLGPAASLTKQPVFVMPHAVSIHCVWAKDVTVSCTRQWKSLQAPIVCFFFIIRWNKNGKW